MELRNKQANPTVLLLLLWSSLSFAANWVVDLDSAQLYQLELQLDPYYSALGVVHSLSSEGHTQHSIVSGERSLYGSMLQQLHRPRSLLFEVSLNPMPIAGVVTKSKAPRFYTQSEVFEGFNVVQILTDGFAEPGTLSFFLGNVVDMVDSHGEVKGRGYSGFLISWGNFHILDNELIDDHWVELELKLKGAGVTPTQELGWSFAIGAKLHFNSDIHHLLYLSLVRTQIDRSTESLASGGVFRNSYFEYRVELDGHRVPRFYRYWDRTAVRYIAIAGKKWPVRGGKNLIGFDLGLLRYVGTGYSGALQEKVERGWSMLFRPSLGF